MKSSACVQLVRGFKAGRFSSSNVFQIWEVIVDFSLMQLTSLARVVYFDFISPYPRVNSTGQKSVSRTLNCFSKSAYALRMDSAEFSTFDVSFDDPVQNKREIVLFIELVI
jgi:hypothetical protein